MRRAVCCAVVAIAMSIAVPAFSGDHVRTISSCQVIDQPGSYSLTKVINADVKDLIPEGPGFPDNVCILIAADFVTLDLNGFSIIGPRSGVGISAGTHCARHGVTVQNGTVTNFWFGLFLIGSDHTVERIRAVNNTNAGIMVGGFVGFTNGMPPPEFFNCHEQGHRVSRNIANGNGLLGIYVGCASVLVENVAQWNTFNILTTDNPAGTCTRFENSPMP